MKVAIPSEMKKVITIAEMPAVNRVIRYAREDGMTVKEYAEMAARIASENNHVKVLEASAEIACNRRVENWFDENSGRFDIWVEFTAVIADGYGGIVMGGAYFTDLVASTGNNSKEIRSHMYIRRFAEVR